jgi:hypothetical protein
MELIALRATIKSNCAFGRQVRRRFDIDGQHACETMKVARAYGTRPEIFTRLSWNALVMLASPSMPAAVRQDLEARILAGEPIGAPQIRRARGKLRSGRPRRPSDQPALRMAA